MLLLKNKNVLGGFFMKKSDVLSGALSLLTGFALSAGVFYGSYISHNNGYEEGFKEGYYRGIEEVATNLPEYLYGPIVHDFVPEVPGEEIKLTAYASGYDLFLMRDYVAVKLHEKYELYPVHKNDGLEFLLLPTNPNAGTADEVYEIYVKDVNGKYTKKPF